MKTLVIIAILTLGLFTAWPTAATPPFIAIIIDGGSPYFVPKSATVSSGAPIRWENPTAPNTTLPIWVVWRMGTSVHSTPESSCRTAALHFQDWFPVATPICAESTPSCTESLPSATPHHLLSSSSPFYLPQLLASIPAHRVGCGPQSDQITSIMKPPVAAHEPLNLTGETLNRLAWHIPDLVTYQCNADEWWVAPLDDNLPLIRLNRTGLEMLQEMNGHT